MLEALADILVDCHFTAMRDQLFDGEKVNVTEDRVGSSSSVASQRMMRFMCEWGVNCF